MGTISSAPLPAAAASGKKRKRAAKSPTVASPSPKRAAKTPASSPPTKHHKQARNTTLTKAAEGPKSGAKSVQKPKLSKLASPSSSNPSPSKALEEQPKTKVASKPHRMAGYNPTEGDGRITDDGEEDESFEEENEGGEQERKEEVNGAINGDESEAEQNQESEGNGGGGGEDNNEDGDNDEDGEYGDDEEDEGDEEDEEEESLAVSDDGEEVEIIDYNSRPPSRAANHSTEVNGGRAKEAPHKTLRRRVLQKQDPNPEPVSDEDIEEPDYTR